MTEDRGQSGDGADPEERAFTGNADMPPEAPDQPVGQPEVNDKPDPG